jgi:hypothetical protein
MKRRGLSDKSSAGQLWGEVQRLRALRSNPSRETSELREELERARARETYLMSELSAAQSAGAEDGIAPDEVAGKPAVAKFRRIFRKFSDAVLRLPATYRRHGHATAEMVIAKTLVADLELFELDAPRGTVESRERHRLRAMLVSPAFKALLMRDEPWAEHARIQFLNGVARSFFRPSVWRSYQHSPDEGAIDKWGTVVK